MADGANETLAHLKRLRKLLFGIFQLTLRLFKIINGLLVLRMVEKLDRTDDDEAE